MRFATYLRRLRRARGMTVTELARRVGVTVAYLSDIEKRPSKRPPTPQRVRDICTALKLRPDEAARLQHMATEERLPAEFRGKVSVQVEVSRAGRTPPSVVSEAEAGSAPDVVSLPVLAEVPAGDPRDVHDEVIEERPVPRSVARAGRYLLRVTGDSMTPVLEDGDIVLVDSTASPRDRNVVAARIAGGTEDESTIKQLYFWSDRVLLHPLNFAYDDMILLRTGEPDETGTELFDYEGRRVRLFLKGVVVAVVWRELRKR